MATQVSCKPGAVSSFAPTLILKGSTNHASTDQPANANRKALRFTRTTKAINNTMALCQLKNGVSAIISARLTASDIWLGEASEFKAFNSLARTLNIIVIPNNKLQPI